MAILNKFVPLRTGRLQAVAPRLANVLRYVLATTLTAAAYGLLAFAVVEGVELALKFAP